MSLPVPGMFPSAQENVSGISVVEGGNESASDVSINVFMADDDAGFLRAYRKLFAKVPDLNLVGVASTGTGLVEQLTRLEPHVLLLDVEMPGSTGIDVAYELRNHSLATRIVILTSFDRDVYVRDSLRFGASGFLLKNTSPVQVLSAIRAVHAGHASLALDVTSRLANQFRPGERNYRTESPGEGPLFTEQQANICGLLAAGYRSQDIADELHLSTETVRTYLRRMFEKFGVKNRTQLVVLAYRAGVIR